MRIKVLWIVNVVLNTFTNEFNIPKKPFGGWIESLFFELKKDKNLEIGLCFPIIDEWRMKNSAYDGNRYYSYHQKMDNIPYNDSMKDEFLPILSDFRPDVIHIWGTEYNHARAMLEACGEVGLNDKVLVRIQGLVSEITKYYLNGVPKEYWNYKEENSTSLVEDQKVFERNGENELIVLSNVKHICDKSDWGIFHGVAINPSATFYMADNILRESFYEEAGQWKIENCRKFSVFLSQANYPIKGLHILLKVVGILKSKYPNILLRIAGLGIFNTKQYGYQKYIAEIINQYDLEDNIEYCGFLDERHMANAYKEANVAVSPSTIENKANSMLEAMMIGTPTIASFVGGNVGAINHGVDGFMYPVEDFVMLAGYIDRIFKDEELAKTLSINAVDTAVKRHDKKMIADKMISIYENMVSQNVNA